MKAKSLVIIGVLIGAFLLTMPVAATYDYVAWGGVNTSTYGVVGDSTGVDAKIEGMHFYDLENTGALISLKSFTPRTGWSRGTIPITQNWSYTQATLKNNSGGIISQGTFGYQITQCNCSEDGELYAYYFASNWNANGLTGDLHLNFNFTDTGFISPKIHAFPSSVPQVDAFSTSAGNQHLSATKYELITNTYKVQRYENITTTLPDNSTYDTMMYNRTLNGVVSSSRVILADTDGVFFNGEGTGDIYFPLIFSKPYFLDVLDPEGGWHNYTFWEGFVSGESCNFTAVAQNIANGAAVAGSTFHVWDLTEDTHESFYLPFGSGEASIPHLQHYYAFNATKTGYTGFDAMPPGGVHVTSCAALQAAPIYAQLMGPPVSETNSTLYVYAHDTSEYGLPIAGATIQLGTRSSAPLPRASASSPAQSASGWLGSGRSETGFHGQVADSGARD